MRYKAVDLREQRDKALFAAYNKALVEHDFQSQGEAIEYVRTHEAPKFYISAEFCAIVIGRLIRGEHPGVYGRQRIRKFRDLYILYLTEAGKPECTELSTREICERIVEMPAPEFYINSRVTGGIINKERERCQADMADRWAL